MHNESPLHHRRLAAVLLAVVGIVLVLIAAAAMGSSIDPATTTTTVVAGATTTIDASPTTAGSGPTEAPVVPTTTTTTGREFGSLSRPATVTSTTTTTTKPPSTAGTPTTTTTTTASSTTTTTPPKTTPSTTTTTTTAPASTETATSSTTTTTTPEPDVTAIISVLSHTGDALAGSLISVDGELVGVTDGTGSLEVTIVPGTYAITATINGTSETRTLDTGGPIAPVVFQTGLVDIRFTGDVALGSMAVTAPIELLPGNHTFAFTGSRAGNAEATLTVEASTSTSYTAMVATLTDSAGGPVAGATVSGWLPPGRTWQPMGATDANGIAIHLHDGVLDDRVTSGTTTIRMQAPAGGSTTVAHNPAEDSFYEFTTSLATIRLVDPEGLPLPGGEASIYTNGRWHTIGTTDSTGITTFEGFPTTYSVAMAFNGTRQQVDGATPHDSPTTFSTGRFTIHFTGSLWWGPGSLSAYDGPQVVLPGTYWVKLGATGLPAATTSIVVGAGDDLVRTGIYASVVDPDGTGVAGGAALVRIAGRPSIGTTDDRGVTAGLLDGLLRGRRSVEVNLNGTRDRLSQDVGASTIFAFTAARATIQVLAPDGTGIPAAGIDQNVGGWKSLGTTDSTGSLEFAAFGATTRNYRAIVDGSSATRRHAFSNGPLVFQQIEAVVRVADTTDQPVSGVDIEQRAKSWTTIGTTDDAGEVTFVIFPGVKLTHRATLGGATVTLGHRFTEASPMVTFDAVHASIRVVDAAGDPIIGIPVEQRTKSWTTIGATDATGSVSLTTFSKKMTYRTTVTGTTVAVAKRFTPTDTELVFTTMTATIRLVTAGGTPIPGVAVEQNAGGWWTIGTSDDDGMVSFEVFEGKKRQYRGQVDGVTRKKGQAFTTTTPILEIVFPD